MGCFDTVIFTCPCGEDIRVQSKAGDCSMQEYRYDGFTLIPNEILGDIIGRTEKCRKCGKVLETTSSVSIDCHFY